MKLKVSQKDSEENESKLNINNLEIKSPQLKIIYDDRDLASLSVEYHKQSLENQKSQYAESDEKAIEEYNILDEDSKLPKLSDSNVELNENQIENVEEKGKNFN